MRQLLLVLVADAVYGLDSHSVSEITAMLPATRLPGAGPEVRGLINLRGRMIPVIDLGHRLTGVPSEAPFPEVVVLSVQGRTLGVLVDEVREVIAVDMPTSPTSELLTAQGPGGLIREVGHFGGAVVLEVDVPELAAQSLA
jgi:purine-binding chemotaxis protein CheW